MDIPTSGPSLHDLAQRLDALERHNEQLSLENRELRDSMPVSRSHSASPAVPNSPNLDTRGSRRWMLRRAMQATAASVAAGALFRRDRQESSAYHTGGDSVNVDVVYAHNVFTDGMIEAQLTHATLPALRAYNSGAGPGVLGTSFAANGIGVTGTGGIGVRGESTQANLYGVYGYHPSGVAVRGEGFVGVHGITYTNGNGAVYGQHTGSAGFGVIGDGVGAANAGMLGRNTSGIGVLGQGVYGVKGTSSAPNAGAVWGLHSNNGPGVVGDGAGTTYPGVLGRNNAGIGVRGDGVYGVKGNSSTPNAGAVWGLHSNDGPGVVGDGAGTTYPGVLGRNSLSEGVRGEGKTGVHGIGDVGVRGVSAVTNSPAVQGEAIGSAIGVKGTSASGYGAVLGGGRAQLRLLPRPTTGKPTTGAHQVGELYLDKVGSLFICTVGGSPGTWKTVTVS